MRIKIFTKENKSYTSDSQSVIKTKNLNDLWSKIIKMFSALYVNLNEKEQTLLVLILTDNIDNIEEKLDVGTRQYLKLKSGLESKNLLLKSKGNLILNTTLATLKNSINKNFNAFETMEFTFKFKIGD